MTNTENVPLSAKCGNSDFNSAESTPNGAFGSAPPPSQDCTSFLELDPKSLTVQVSMGELDVKVESGAECNDPDEVVFALHRLLEHTPLGWNWSLDVAVLQACDIRLMDAFLALGRELRERGGCLVIKGLRASAFPPPFGELFRRRCQEEEIEITEVAEP